MLYPVSALFCSGCSCKLCERPLQDAYKSCLVFVSRGGGAAWAVSSVIACSGTEGTGISRVLGSVSSGANSVSKSLFPTISFLVVFFQLSHFSEHLSFIPTEQQEQLCCQVLGVTGREWPLHQKLSVSQYFGLFQVFFSCYNTIQSLNYSVVFSPDSKHQVEARAA